MPFYRGDPDMYDEIMSEVDEADLPPDMEMNRPSGEFEYHAAEGKFDAKRFAKVARLVFDTLRGLGATAFRVRYDGGYDEGFAHADAVLFGDSTRSATGVAKELNTPEFVARLRAAAAQLSHTYYEGIPDGRVAQYALDELAHEIASVLLGEGYGTGEYELYGAFTADLATGEIEDDPSAPAPRGKS